MLNGKVGRSDLGAVRSWLRGRRKSLQRGGCGLPGLGLACGRAHTGAGSRGAEQDGLSECGESDREWERLLS